MKSAQICQLSLACIGGAVAFGFAVNATIDLIMPPTEAMAMAVSAPENAAAEEAQPAAAAYSLASVTSTPVDLAPVKVKTIPMLYTTRSEMVATQPAPEPAAVAAAAAPAAAAPAAAAVPLPRPRPASAPVMAMAEPIAHQAGTLAIAAATRKGAPDDGEVLGAAGIERMKTALALTAEQEEYWPAIATELRALGKVLKTNAKQNGGKISVDDETMQRLYWAAAPLISRLSYEQKTRVKQMARMMGLTQVAEAL
jgi:hypothetical protein